jgi:hypothetical protein
MSDTPYDQGFRLAYRYRFSDADIQIYAQGNVGPQFSHDLDWQKYVQGLRAGALARRQEQQQKYRYGYGKKDREQ